MEKVSSDYITHIKNPEDVLYLRTKLLNVNMRLFKTSGEYKKLILQACNYIKFLALTEMKGYKKPHGMSAANAGISWNIIGIVVNRGKSGERCDIMINPEITEYFGDVIEASTNCGSLTLSEPITIKRHSKCRVRYYDIDGRKYHSEFNRLQRSLTIQHEVDHNNGVLIIDYQNENIPEYVIKRANAVIARIAFIDQYDIRSDTTLESLGLDSLDEVELIMDLEKEFSIHIRDEDVETLTTADALYKYIANRILNLK